MQRKFLFPARCISGSARVRFGVFWVGMMTLGSAVPALASCGSAFCSVNTDLHSLKGAVQPGWNYRLQFEYIDQDQLRSGTDEIGVDVVDEHHVELRTINRNWLIGLDYGINERWGVGLTVPFVDRDHKHLHHHHGEELIERWSMGELGDLRAQGRYQLTGGDPNHASSALHFGLKLPTGEHDIRNRDGDQAERSLQPGSGTTDLILSLNAIKPLGAGSSLFADLSVQLPLNKADEYRPGRLFQADVGWSHLLANKVSLYVQANLAHKTRDSGAESEPDNSGSTKLSISPGVGYALSRAVLVYGFLQLPIYQDVNGVQSTFDYALSLGIHGEL